MMNFRRVSLLYLDVISPLIIKIRSKYVYHKTQIEAICHKNTSKQNNQINRPFLKYPSNQIYKVLATISQMPPKYTM